MKFTLPPHIPVRVTLGFWITSALIGLLLSGNFVGMFMWTAIIFVSIIVHEYGHAISSSLFGQHPRIELIPFGGLTYPEGKKVKGWQEFVVIFCGPLFGFGLFLLALALYQIPALAASSAAPFIKLFATINLFWTVVNLLPVLPLDGGQLVRVICQGFSPEKGLRIALIASLLLAVGMGVAAFIVGYFLIGAIFTLFAFQNFELYRRMKSMTQVDQDEEHIARLESAERALESQKPDEAKTHLQELLTRTKRGLIFNTAAQALAKLYIDEEQWEKAYTLLKNVRKELSDEGLYLFHQAAYEMQDYKLTLELAGPCFQFSQDPLLAFRTARAAAILGKLKPTLGWLAAAEREGLTDFKEGLNDPVFDIFRTQIQAEFPN